MLYVPHDQLIKYGILHENMYLRADQNTSYIHDITFSQIDILKSFTKAISKVEFNARSWCCFGVDNLSWY